MSNNPLQKLSSLGQSVWLDLIRRNMLDPGGEMQKLIEKDGVRGVTSNPAIFEKAINGSADYDDEIRALGKQGKDAAGDLRACAIDDVGRAADYFRPSTTRRRARDGFVSIEVSPKLAHDTDGTVAEARRLWKALNRPNIMIKVPGTKAGLPAVASAPARGINVNITLLFAVERYEACWRPTSPRSRTGRRKGSRSTASRPVASFFLSRIDTLLDPQIQKIAGGGGPKADIARGLPGHDRGRQRQGRLPEVRIVTGTERWKKLAAKGAAPAAPLGQHQHEEPQVQRLRCTSSRSSAPTPSNTMPMETVDAYRDHGKPASRITRGRDGRAAEARRS
jgi:transaldolase